MNKLINNIITLGKSFYGLVIYFAVAFIFNYIIKSIPNITYIQHNILLIIEKLPKYFEKDLLICAKFYIIRERFNQLLT